MPGTVPDARGRNTESKVTEYVSVALKFTGGRRGARATVPASTSCRALGCRGFGTSLSFDCDTEKTPQEGCFSVDGRVSTGG